MLHSVGEAPFIKSYTLKTEKVKVTVKNSKETLVRRFPRGLPIDRCGVAIDQ